MQASPSRQRGGVTLGARITTIVVAAFLSVPMAALADENPSDTAERSKLLTLVARRISDPAVVAGMRASAMAFENRIHDTAEISATYRAVEQFLADDHTVVDADEKSYIAWQILHQAADPCSINQGHHNTCALAALESRMFSKYPSIAADVVTQVASSGSYRDARGNQINIDPGNIHADCESGRGKIDDRSHASQLFQLSAANEYWQTRQTDPRGLRCGKGRIQYIQKNTRTMDDTGERLVIKWDEGVVETVVEDSGLPMSEPAITLANVQEISNLMLPGKQDTFVIGGDKFDKSQKYLAVKTMGDLRNRLSNGRNGASLPIVAAVNPEAGCFKGDLDQSGDRTWSSVPLESQRGDQRRTLGGGKSKACWHAVCITDYDAETDMVSVDNFWGPGADHVGANAVKLAQLYDAIQNADN